MDNFQKLEISLKQILATTFIVVQVCPPPVLLFIFALQLMLTFNVFFNICIIVEGSIAYITQCFFHLEMDSFDMLGE